MNVTELARKLRVNTKELLEILPEYGFDIGKKAIKIDDRTATKVMKQWRFIKKELEDKKRKELEEKKNKEKELRRESGQKIVLGNRITVKHFAEKMEMSVTQVITELMKNGILANQNQDIDYDTAAIMAEELGFSVQKEDSQNVETEGDEQKNIAIEEAIAKGDNMQRRAPVIVVMGHVDHGKTSLLDTIRKANILDTESGGITQHIGAYQTIWKDPKTKEERALSFIDTPGHEAFTVMRSRGAKVADIAILVVAADDGVKPQTKEVIQIIKAAKMPFIVAINKIDKEAADIDKVKGELGQFNIIPEDWGGDVPMVGISAKQNMNIDKLLDVLLLVADVHEDDIKADPTIAAVGTVIESHVDKNIGPVATVLIQAGTLHKNDPLVIYNEIYGTVRAMKDYHGEVLLEAGPSTPVQIIGFKVAPEVGDLIDLSTAKTAKKIDVKRKKSEQTRANKSTITSIILDEEDKEKTKTLNLVIKADVLGSLEAIIGSLEKLKHPEVGIKIVGKGLGNITEDDVHKAEAGHAYVIGFHVKPTTVAEEIMQEKSVEFKEYSIIYDLINWAKEELADMLSDEVIVTDIGNFKTLAIFRTDKKAMTIGGKIEKGYIVPGAKVKIKRAGQVVGEGEISEVRIGADVVKKAESGTECGLRFEGRDTIEVGDVLEFHTVESKSRDLIFEK